MPRTTRRLKDAALLCIAKNISYWTNMIPEDAENYLYLISPFEILDYGLTQLIFDALIKFNTFQPKHIHLIFHGKLDSIDLSKCAAYRLGDVILKTLFKRCKRIKTLIISGRTRFSTNLINSVPLKYQNLQSLVITHESIRKDLISNLASCCKSLTCFQSGTCCKISDETFKKLTSLQNLKVLFLGNADLLSWNTILSILISCKKLNRLSLPMTLLDFKFLNEGFVFDTLATLDLTLVPVDDVSIEKITISFPRLANLCLSNCEHVSSRALIAIGNNCKYLEDLNISYTGIKRFSRIFEEFLAKVGEHLHCIDVSGMSGIKTSVFGRYCKNLEKLYMNHCQGMVTDWITVADETTRSRSHANETGKAKLNVSLLEACRLLTTLQIDARNKAAEEYAFDLEVILRNGHLKSLSLNSIPGLNDDELRRMIEFMTVNDLRHLNLSGNQNVTVNGVWFVIEKINNLETLKIMECDVVTQEFNDMKRKVKKMGYEVQIVR